MSSPTAPFLPISGITDLIPVKQVASGFEAVQHSTMRNMAAFKRLWFKPPERNFAFLLFCILLLVFLVSAGPLPDTSIDGPHLAEGDHLGISPSGSDQPHPAGIIARGEINPVAQKLATTPDADMPGYPDFSPLAKSNLSYYDDPLLQICSTKPMQAMFPTYRGIGNGCVYFYFHT